VGSVLDDGHDGLVGEAGHELDDDDVAVHLLVHTEHAASGQAEKHMADKPSTVEIARCMTVMI
jgi:hypothetical protein